MSIFKRKQKLDNTLKKYVFYEFTRNTNDKVLLDIKEIRFKTIEELLNSLYKRFYYGEGEEYSKMIASLYKNANYIFKLDNGWGRMWIFEINELTQQKLCEYFNDINKINLLVRKEIDK